MNLENKNFVLIGATGDIGSAVAKRLHIENVNLLLVGRDEDKLIKLNKDFTKSSFISADINLSNDRDKIFKSAINCFSKVDAVINIAGLMNFSDFLDEKDETTISMFQTNVISPMLLNKLFAKHMVTNGLGSIVNIGSIFGSIPFALFSSYSATKSALKAYSESLRRELYGSGVDIIYIAPRAVKTKFNSEPINKMCQKFNISMDDPIKVADEIILSIKSNKKDKYIGFPEKLFVKVNAILPRLVDIALKKQNKEARKFLN